MQKKEFFVIKLTTIKRKKSEIFSKTKFENKKNDT